MPWKKSEALHGLSSRGPATKFDDPAKPHLHSGRAAVYNGVVFANVMNSTASFNETLSKSTGRVHAPSLHTYTLLILYGTLDTNMHPQHQPAARPALETPGEGPFVVGRYAVNFVRGMQDILGHDTAADPSPGRSRRRRAASTTPPTISTTGTATPASSRRARPGARDMVETFLRPFEMCVRDGDVSSVMCSYNRVSGIPACADARLLSQTIRWEWQFHGYIVSDCEAVRVMVDNVTWLGYTAVKGSAAIVLDRKPAMDFVTTYGMPAVAKGKVFGPVWMVASNCPSKILVVDHRMGQRLDCGQKDICSDEQWSLAVDGARQGMVLLKNQDNLLSLDTKKLGDVAVRGPHAQAPEKVMGGEYTGPPCRYVTPRECISISSHVKVALSRQCDHLLWWHKPAHSKKYLNKNYHVSSIHHPCRRGLSRVIFSGGGIAISFAQHDPKIGAILWAGYPSAEGGNAIADIIFGRYNPRGRLPLTWFKNDYIHKIPMTSMELRPVPKHGYPGRTYKFYQGLEVPYPFGYGLNYTKFLYKTGTNGTASRSTISFNVSITNGGHTEGSHSVLMYTAPIKQVVAFQRVSMRVGCRGGTADVRFTVNVHGVPHQKTAYSVVQSGVSTVLIDKGAGSSVSFPVKIKFTL
ncbi:hypothetical protein VPH35_138227 [Triticum aestivum]